MLIQLLLQGSRLRGRSSARTQSRSAGSRDCITGMLVMSRKKSPFRLKAMLNLLLPVVLILMGYLGALRSVFADCWSRLLQRRIHRWLTGDFEKGCSATGGGVSLRLPPLGSF